MAEVTTLHPEHQLDALTVYLFGDRERIVETAEDACRRLVESVNAFFGTVAFFISHWPRGSFRIGCACGWSLSLLLPADLEAPLAECLARMLLHYEIQHLQEIQHIQEMQLLETQR